MEIYETTREIAQRKNWLLSLVVIVLITFGVLIVLQGIALFVALFLFGIDLDSVVKLMSVTQISHMAEWLYILFRE